MVERINVEKINESRFSVVMNIPSNEVDKHIEDFINSVKDKIKVNGFRDGKIPMSHLRQVVGKKAYGPVSQKLLSDCYMALQKDFNINPIGMPYIEDVNDKEGYVGKFGFDNSFYLKFLIDVLPKIDPVGYTGIKIEVKNDDLGKVIDKKILKYREQFSEKSQITDRGAREGDSIVIDFVGKIDGNIFDGGSAQSHFVEKLGAKTLIPGFEEQIIGMKCEESKTISVRFPDDYRAQHIAGKEATFDVCVRSIVESKLAEVDNDLALMAGFDSIDKFKDNIEEESKKEIFAITKQREEKFILDKIIELNKFEAPSSLVIEQEKNMLSKIGAEAKNIPDDMKKAIKNMAIFSVKRSILLDAIYEKEKSLELTPDEMDIALEEQAKINNKSKEEIITLLNNTKQMDGFIGLLKNKKTINFIINNSNK